MPVHDWTLVDAGIFHGFHTLWIGEINKALNSGVLPEGYYALPEQHAGCGIADVLTLRAGDEESMSASANWGTAVAEAPPRVSRRQTVEQAVGSLRRTIAIRHISGHRLIAMIEILSPANKDRARSVEEFAAKAVDALDAGVHLLVLDLFPPASNDPDGIHAVICQWLQRSDDRYDLPSGKPLTLAAYAAGDPVEAYLEHVSVGSPLPEMPLFLRSDRYINAPLQATYDAAYEGFPSIYRRLLETS